MAELTINLPSPGLEGVFHFKEPYGLYLRNQFGLVSNSIRMKVVSVISLKDNIRNDARDPFSELYSPLGISESDYKLDVVNGVPIISLSFLNDKDVERIFRVPASYIESIDDLSNVDYLNRFILIDLNKLPITLDTTVLFPDIRDKIINSLGIPDENIIIKEVSLGGVESISTEEHDMREVIRQGVITENQTLSARLTELELLYSSLVDRLDTIGIELWD